LNPNIVWRVCVEQFPRCGSDHFHGSSMDRGFWDGLDDR
jgi:hypothetical protein